MFTAGFQSIAFQTVFGGSSPPAPVVTNDGGFFPIKKRKPSRRVEIETEQRLAFDKVISEIYDRMHGILPELQQEIAEIVTQKKAKRDISLPPRPQLDVESIMRDMVAVKRLVEIHRQMMLEEEMMILMMAL